MPEGHTIHRAARQQQRLLGGDILAACSPQGRFAESAARLDGARLRRVEAWGKHLFSWFDGGDILHVHLGLFGRFTVHTPASSHRSGGDRPATASEQSPDSDGDEEQGGRDGNGNRDGNDATPAPSAAVRLRLIGPKAVVDLSGPTICRLIDPAGRDAVVARLGPDPLRREAGGGERFAAHVRASRAPIGALLMNQSVVAGVGNVYRAEALFLEGIHPDTPGRSLTGSETAALWATIVRLLGEGMRRGAIVTVDPTVLGRPLRTVRRGEGTWVYGREDCRRCGAAVRRWEMAGRRCHACETCQPPAPHDVGA